MDGSSGIWQQQKQQQQPQVRTDQPPPPNQKLLSHWNFNISQNHGLAANVQGANVQGAQLFNPLSRGVYPSSFSPLETSFYHPQHVQPHIVHHSQQQQQRQQQLQPQHGGVNGNFAFPPPRFTYLQDQISSQLSPPSSSSPSTSFSSTSSFSPSTGQLLNHPPPPSTYNHQHLISYTPLSFIPLPSPHPSEQPFVSSSPQPPHLNPPVHFNHVQQFQGQPPPPSIGGVPMKRCHSFPKLVVHYHPLPHRPSSALPMTSGTIAPLTSPVLSSPNDEIDSPIDEEDSSKILELPVLERVSHNEAEQIRRDRLKNSFKILRTVLAPKEKSPSKAQLLKYARHVILTLRHNLNQNNGEIQQLLGHISSLHLYMLKIDSSLQIPAIPVLQLKKRTEDSEAVKGEEDLLS